MTDVPGIVYILEFDRPVVGAQRKPGAKRQNVCRYYIGWSSKLEERLWHHEHGQGAKLTRLAVEQGIGWRVVYQCEGTRALERRFHDYKNTPRLLKTLLKNQISQ